MASTDPICRLIATIQPSILMYLADSGIWSYPGEEPIKLALADAVDDLKSVVDRAAYPLSFTGLHDVELRSLLPRVIDGLRRQLAEIDAITGAAGTDASAADLVADAKQSLRQHVDALEQVTAKVKAGIVGGAAAAAAS
jgi:hypothetical protein